MKPHILAVAAGLALVAGPVHAFDDAGTRAVVGETVMAINAGDVVVTHLVGLQQQPIEIGVDGARDLAITVSELAELPRFRAAGAPAMTALTLEEIEPAWHASAAFAEAGFDIRAPDHFEPAQNTMDAIIDPATTVIAPRTFETSAGNGHLDQVIDVLSEVVDHLSVFQ